MSYREELKHFKCCKKCEFFKTLPFCDGAEDACVWNVEQKDNHVYGGKYFTTLKKFDSNWNFSCKGWTPRNWWIKRKLKNAEELARIESVGVWTGTERSNHV
jgi:hypothetical protein